MDFDEILGLEDIDAEEMVLVVGGGVLVVNTHSGLVFKNASADDDFRGLANAIENGAPFAYVDDGGGGT